MTIRGLKLLFSAFSSNYRGLNYSANEGLIDSSVDGSDFENSHFDIIGENN